MIWPVLNIYNYTRITINSCSFTIEVICFTCDLIIFLALLDPMFSIKVLFKSMFSFLGSGSDFIEAIAKSIPWTTKKRGVIHRHTSKIRVDEVSQLLHCSQ